MQEAGRDARIHFSTGCSASTCLPPFRKAFHSIENGPHPAGRDGLAAGHEVLDDSRPQLRGRDSLAGGDAGGDPIRVSAGENGRHGDADPVADVDEGRTVEVATIGNEGIVGLSAYIGDGRSSMEVFVQIPGEAVRMDAGAFRQEIRSGGALRDVVRRYAQALLTQAGNPPPATESIRSSNGAHDGCSCRTTGDEIVLTQEFLAEMLGVRRAGVTRAAGMLKRRKVIDYRRGRIRILDRKGLEKAACECYEFIRSEHERLVG